MQNLNTTFLTLFPNSIYYFLICYFFDILFFDIIFFDIFIIFNLNFAFKLLQEGFTCMYDSCSQEEIGMAALLTIVVSGTEEVCFT